MTGLQQKRAAEWRNGWPLVLCSCTGVALPSMMNSTMGVFMQSLQAEFGWSRALITAGLAVNGTVGVALAGFVGILIDRIGPRRIALPGVAMFCAAFAVLTTVNGSQYQWFALWGLIALCATMVQPTLWVSAIVSRFDAARGTATSLALVGSSITVAISPIIAGYLIHYHGWRSAYLGLAVLYFCVSFPLIWRFFYSRQDLARRRNALATIAPEKSHQVRSRFGGALRAAPFYQIAGSCVLVILIIQITLIHFIPIIRGFGIGEMPALFAASLIGFSAIAGRLGSGFMLDRFSGSRVGGTVSLFPAASMACLLLSHQFSWLVYPSAVFIGLTHGAETELASYLSSRYLPSPNYGALFGLMVGLIALASGTGPLLAGWFYDTYQTYEPIFWCAIPVSVLGSALLFFLGPVPAAPTQHPHPDTRDETIRDRGLSA